MKIQKTSDGSSHQKVFQQISIFKSIKKFLPELHADMLGKYSRNFTE